MEKNKRYFMRYNSKKDYLLPKDFIEHFEYLKEILEDKDTEVKSFIHMRDEYYLIIETDKFRRKYDSGDLRYLADVQTEIIDADNLFSYEIIDAISYFTLYMDHIFRGKVHIGKNVIAFKCILHNIDNYNKFKRADLVGDNNFNLSSVYNFFMGNKYLDIIEFHKEEDNLSLKVRYAFNHIDFELLKDVKESHVDLHCLNIIIPDTKNNSTDKIYQIAGIIDVSQKLNDPNKYEVTFKLEYKEDALIMKERDRLR